MEGSVIHHVGAGKIGRDDHAECAAQVEGIRQYHKSHGYRDIAYCWLACQHGGRFEGRGWGPNAATGNTWANQNLNAICALIGDEAPTDLLLQALYDLTVDAPNGRKSITSHSDWYPTSCCGDHLRAWVAVGALPPGGQVPSGGGTTPSETVLEADMIYVANGRALAMQGPIIVGDWSGDLNQFGIPKGAQEFSANQIPIRFVHELVLAKLVLADEAAIIVPTGGSGGGLTEAQVRNVVRSELNATRLGT